MKQINTTCPKCGGKLTVDRRNQRYVCDYCGTEYAMEEDEVRYTNSDKNSGNSRGNGGTRAAKCKRCGSTNIKYRRERESSNGYYYKTTAMCQDCGHTWTTSSDVVNRNTAIAEKKKSKWMLVLWVIGWICVFPIPLTIIMLRNKSVVEKLSDKVRYGIIAAAWIVYILIAIFGGNEEKSTTASSSAASTEISSGFEAIPDDTQNVADVASTEDATSSPQSLAGTDAADYFSILCTLAEITDVPAGSNDGEYTVYTAENDHYRFTVKALTANNEIVSVDASSDLDTDAQNFFNGAINRMDYSSEDDAAGLQVMLDYYDGYQDQTQSIGDATITMSQPAGDGWITLNVTTN